MIPRAPRYTSLPTTTSWSFPARYTVWWRKRTVRGTTLLVVVIVFVVIIRKRWTCLVEYWNGDSGDEAAVQFDPSLDSAYVPFRPSRPTTSDFVTLKPSTELPSSCLDAHITQGELCYNPKAPRLDVLWTWVNGSDILFKDAVARVENSLSPDDPYRPTQSFLKVRQFRDHDELRYSLRSVLQFFRQHAGKFHLVTADFGVDAQDLNATMTPSEWRLGQIPQWLDPGITSWSDDKIKLSTIHHADIFDPYNGTIFNSYAIESQFGHLEGVSENFIYMNDDFFFLTDLSEKSFYTSPYGVVLRMQADLMVAPEQYRKNVIRGEWRSLGAANHLLGERFGFRVRPYVTHEAKSSSISILHEISQIWSSDIAFAATHPFRETKSGEMDPSMIFLMVHFTVERWREALLWTWIVGKHGSLDDSWGEEQTMKAWDELKAGSTDEEMGRKLFVRGGNRSSLEYGRVDGNLKRAGVDANDPTKYEFSSQDGYPYVGFINGKNWWPKLGFGVPKHESLQCSIDPADCFTDEHGQPFTRASDLLTHVAFRRSKCGDCIITALVHASGPLGLSAFLPPSSRTLPSLAGKVSQPKTDPIPHLPLEKKWEDAKFSLREVMGASPSMSVREWSLRLLQRYRFVIAETPSHFAMISNPVDAMALTRRVRRDPGLALLCVNDDITREDKAVDELLHRLFSDTWPTPAAWERRV
ncbi:hypothetical protein BDY19DRAFT_165838 [Irpex rosettiformis]|uniref:Uncharacterized protein n=1 Tax=Irpex rosettiformis TaxID=378272 RepID=A0ACB8U2K5_9APHY|nr:hypothetical protein BDY19DRAFT_165838 [Irpex rosettiformis]